MCMHSYSPAQKSSGAFFHDMDRERCRKRLSRLRMALRAPAAVRPSSLMLNSSVPSNVKKPLGSGFSGRIVRQYSYSTSDISYSLAIALVSLPQAEALVLF